MAITRAMCTSFKVEMLKGIHDLDTDTIKIALYTNMASLGPGTTAYTTAGEVSGTGYTAGGKTLTGATVSYTGTTAWFDCDDVLWTGAAFTTRGALIYNASKSNRAIAVVTFGTDQSPNNNDFEIVMPAPGAYTGLLRIT